MKKVLCIGSVTCDILMTPVDHFPAPGVLQSVDRLYVSVGGCAANAAIDLGKLGMTVALSCKVGRDSFGDFVIESAAENRVDTRWVVRSESELTTTSVVMVNSVGERCFLYYPGSAARFDAGDVPAEALRWSDIVFVAGAMLLTDFDGEPCAAVLKNARSFGKMTVMDTAWDFQDIWLPKILPALAYVDLFMPSLEEAKKLTGAEDVAKIADRLFDLGVTNVVIKLGAKGAYICPRGGERVHIPTYDFVKAVDTTGAGDAFCAGFLAGLIKGYDFYDSGRIANAVGTHCVMKMGASAGIVPFEEIIGFLEKHDLRFVGRNLHN